jgi:cytochrome b-561
MSRLAVDTNPLLLPTASPEADGSAEHLEGESMDTDPLLPPAADAADHLEEPLDDDGWSNRIATVQRTANVVAHILSFMCVLVVIWWISLLGGLSFWNGQSSRNKTHVFNWHPLLMITAFCFMTVAALAFRSRQRNAIRRVVLKFTHGMAWTVAALCAIVALLAVVQSHNDATVSGKFIANLYSLHSWIGVGVIIMYMVQFGMGVFTFACPTLSFMSSSPNKKARIMRIHKFMGPFIYNCAAATILLGIEEKEGFIGCSYAVSSPDLFPPRHFLEIPYSCRVSHLLGVLVLAVTLCANLALHQFQKGGSVDTASSHHEL